MINENKSNIFDCLYFVWIIFILMCNDSIWMGQIIKHKLDSLSLNYASRLSSNIWLFLDTVLEVTNRWFLHLFLSLLAGLLSQYGWGTSPLGHLYSRHTSRGQKIWPLKNVHIIFESIISVGWTPLFRGKGHFLWVPKPGFNLHSGDTLTLKKWPNTKRVDL